MTAPTSWTADHREPTEARTRRLALTAGALFIATFVTAIAAVVLYQPLLGDPSQLLGAGADTRVFAGATLELALIVANIGTALALFPLLRRQSESLALGYVAARIVECVFIAVGIVSLLAVVSVQQETTGVATASQLAITQTLVAIHDWTFLLGPGFVVGVGNGMLLGYLMYRSGLVPRRMAMLGLVGGPLVCASGIAVMFGAVEAGGPVQFLATVPEIAWEGSLGVYLLVKGLRTSSPWRAPRPGGELGAVPSA
jgi:hypothetical protein